MTAYLTTETHQQRPTFALKKVGLSHFAGRESQLGGSVLRKKFSTKFPHLLKAKRRYASCLPTAQTQTLLKKTISDKLK